MSSMTKAAARPVSTIRNASAWSLAARMLRLRPFCAPISVICLILVVPEVDATVLPLRSSTVFRFADFFDTKRFAVTKWVMVNETCFCRSRLLVVEPHSRSTVPLAISGIRVAEVTGRNGAGVLDLLERAGELLCERRAGSKDHGRNHRKQHFETH